MHGITLGRRHSATHGAPAALSMGGRNVQNTGGKRGTLKLGLAGITSLAAALCVLSTSPASSGGGGSGGGLAEKSIVAASPAREVAILASRGSVASMNSEARVHSAASSRNASHTLRRANSTAAALKVDDSISPSMRSSRRRTQENPSQQKDIRPFRILTSAEISKQLHGLAGKYPEFATLTSAQEKYDLPAAGTAKDCDHDHQKGTNGGGKGTGGEVKKGCKNWILTIEDKNGRAKEGTDSAKSLPEVFLSGALHGDERVGPTSVTEAAALLLDSAACEFLPRRGDQVQDPALEMRMALDCRSDLRNRGVDDVGRRWLARLVATRRIVIVPTANALGYERKRRTEDSIDPNRDFPYDLQDWSLCMQTIAGRTINEIFREHVFQLSITFHAGMEAVAYEWGAPTYLHFTSPDDVAQAQIASGYSRFANGFASGRGKTPPYQTGTMNDVVYYVRGGMEDWAYAASWDPDRAKPCKPKTFGGYPAEKTQYDETTLRIFNMLVETSNDKTPREGTLGTTEDVLSGDTAGNGHVSRNVRLALLAIDLVEPYVSVTGVDGVALSDDVVPSVDLAGRTCVESKSVKIAPGRKDVEVEWTVGGGFAVDDTAVVHAKWEDLPDSIDGNGHPLPDELHAIGDKLSMANLAQSKGATRWHPDGPIPPPHAGSSKASGPVFTATIDASLYKPGDKFAVFAAAKLDQSWSTQPPEGGKVKPAGGPRAHVVRARTDPDWNMVQKATGKVVRGRYDWYSVPVTLVVGEDGAATVELFSRLSGTEEESGSSERKENGTLGKQIPGVDGVGASGTSSGTSTDATPNAMKLSNTVLAGIAAGVIILSAALLLLLRRRRRQHAGYRSGPVRGDSQVWDTGFREEDAYNDDEVNEADRTPYTDNPEGSSMELPERFTID